MKRPLLLTVLSLFMLSVTTHRARAQAWPADKANAWYAQKPWHVAGTGRFCTEIMQLFGARVFVKTGAEGVYCGALPEFGLGIALKCDDGAGRAAQAVMAATIARFLPLEPAERAVRRAGPHRR